MINVCRQAAWFGIILLFSQVIPLPLTHVYAETDNTVDPQLVEEFRSSQPEYLNSNQSMISSEKKTEVVQEFSFVNKTSRTTVGQPVLLHFKSNLPANEVLLRIPAPGQIFEAAFSNGESIQHSYGEYWTLKTSKQQTEFFFPLIFEEAGQYFLTIDNDADHFYLEVEEKRAETRTSAGGSRVEEDLSEQAEPSLNDQQQETKSIETTNEMPIVVQPVMVTEKNLSISEALIAAENARILQEITDPQNRSSTSVSNWSQFRSAWNSSGTSQIILTATINYSNSILGSSLNARNASIFLKADFAYQKINFMSSKNFLEMNGTANLLLDGISIPGSSNTPVKHNGSGLVDIRNSALINHTQSAGAALEAQNINLSGYFEIQSVGRTTSAISVVRGGTITITPHVSARSYIVADFGSSYGGNNAKPISMGTTSRIILNTNRLTMADPMLTPRSSWFQVNAILNGANGSQVVSSTSDPNDFAERYVELFNERWYSSLIFSGSGSGFEPPIQTGSVTVKYVDNQGNELSESESFTGNVGTAYTTSPKDIDGWSLTEMPSNATGLFTQEPITVEYRYQRIQRRVILQANLAEGGAPSADKDILIDQEETEIHANTNEGYRFVSWEILSGTGAMLADETSENTTFTMGSSDVVLQANYEEEATDVPPLDPLDPEKEINPENPPQLPKDQGPISIDFVSQFAFGIQVISAQDQTYYAKPQRLLTEDGTVMKEERPNYVQVSDRRSESKRDGWTLSVRQLENFQTKNKDHELIGARLRFLNQQIATAQDGTPPGVQETSDLTLIPGEKHILLQAKGTEGAGTWIYRFGDAQSAAQSVALDVPKTANPNAAQYQTTLSWELSAVPDN
ncbi:MAG TPA: hypothetical protein DIT57_13295 [Enterococcus sp.]|nr:hypothetical protein [Enterococcus sp.]